MKEDPLPTVATASPLAQELPYDEPDLFAMARTLLQHWKLIIGGALMSGLTALGVAMVITPMFSARTSMLPPQQPQSAAASALASLGALGGLAGAAAVRSPVDQYVALMQSTTVADRLIEQFDLAKVYDVTLRVDTRRILAGNTRISVGKKDGLIVVEVDDADPRRAANLANAYVEELRRLTSVFAVSEAQQRRAFFEAQLKDSRDELMRAQEALQATGFSLGALRAEPRAAADSYARLRAELTAAEVRLQILRGSLSENAVEVQQQQATVAALRAQLARLEQVQQGKSDPDYLSKYREFKYQETLFDLFARQYELARVDEAREGALIQVLDAAQPPERKSRPKRAQIAVVATLAAAALLALFVLVRERWRISAAVERPGTASAA